MFYFVPEYMHSGDGTGTASNESQRKKDFLWNSTMSLLGRAFVPAENEEGEYAYHSGIEKDDYEKRHSFHE